MTRLWTIAGQPGRRTVVVCGTRSSWYVSFPFFTDVARGAQQIADEAGLGLFLCNSNQDRTVEHRYLDLLAEQRVRGVLITPIDPDGTTLAHLTKRGIPLVLVDRASDAHSCSVSVNDRAGGAMAARHLIEQGHRRIVYIGGPETRPQVRDRHTGALEAVHQAGLPTKALLSVPTETMTVSSGRQAGRQVLRMPPRSRPTAAFCANDPLALGFLQEMTQRGVRIPSQMAIIGHDDIEFAEAAAIPLTSVHQPREALGRTAAQLLLEESQTTNGHAHRQVQFQPELIVRASTAAPGIEPPAPKPFAPTGLAAQRYIDSFVNKRTHPAQLEIGRKRS